MLNRGVISVIIWATFIHIWLYNHACSFILYTGMPVVDGGLSYDEAQNGRIFAVIGIAGILTQGYYWTIIKKTGAKKLLPLSCFVCGTGLILIPYTRQNTQQSS